jgi:hypothetical protein
MANTKLVPFDDMPDTIYPFLTLEDFSTALIHHNGYIIGMFEVIHLNKKYPHWHNLMINPQNNKTISVYTINGWQERDSDEILDKLNLKCLKSLAYFYENDILSNKPTYGIIEKIISEIQNISS